MEATNAAKERTGIAPVKVAFSSVSALLTMIRDPTINKQDYIELESSCNDICEALDRGMNGRSDDLNEPLLEAINQLTTISSLLLWLSSIVKIIATGLGCTVPDTNSMTSDENARLEQLFTLIIQGHETFASKDLHVDVSKFEVTIAFLRYAARREENGAVSHLIFEAAPPISLKHAALGVVRYRRWFLQYTSYSDVSILTALCLHSTLPPATYVPAGTALTISHFRQLQELELTGGRPPLTQQAN
ncbi:hypothetical protein BDM02DRAFT_3187374 [Thelephora ganbajun]|uniref:Uncharacterized protein n=1 Tax=Thelephora ganbajun TaxID=370292 RepID=A0ACB6ZEU1_THEGA|nr:hypothetical protein BDM02DRAFT_3187374 [Thelephora ganbajun]